MHRTNASVRRVKILIALLCLIFTFSIAMGCGGTTEIKQETLDVTYTRTTTVENAAGGTVVIAKNDLTSETIANYRLCWGNDSGVLDGYSNISSSSAIADTVTISLPTNLAIPSTATKMIVLGIAKSGEIVSNVDVALPTGAKSTAKLLYEFQVLSDQQVLTSNPNFYNRSVKSLKDIKQNSPNTSFIIHNGDLVDRATEENYQSFVRSITTAYGEDAPTMYYNIGNHEAIPTDGQSYEDYLNLFYKYTGNTTPYFSHVINGSYYIFLGSTEMPDTLDGNTQASITLGTEQLEWFEEQMELADATGNPIYVFSHQALRDTVSGSLTSLNQTWYGYTTKEDAAVKTIINKYPQTLFFSGHSHWCFESEAPYVIDADGPNFFNSAAVGYLWQGTGGGTHYAGGSYVGSQGLYVEVYESYVLIKGRSFENANVQTEWYTPYQVVIPLNTTY